MVRVLVSILLGAAVTFALFVLMAFLISGGEQRNEPPEAPATIDIVQTQADQEVDARRRTPPPPPPPPETPPESPPQEPQATDDAVSFNLDLGDVNIGAGDTGLSGPGAGMSRDGDAQPLVRVEPRYPAAAARDGIEGWVRLRFTINEVGGVEDIEIIEAEPRRVFDREARAALRRWRYAAKMVDGVPVRQEGMTVQLDFTMEGG
ncbi:energy transducer TonB [Aliidiomarina taiwanensis]|uniref:Protein TonB n=1 Tax=Aliidiomarina taiwanensis TaxID=946228 RepID=A0A432X2C4_9GAMM|nr:TonB family protein [Aliidiomarina taiwanensis]RUO40598.1 energy transducer TonB [Aliidiomarina taiwanensis]